MVLALAKLRGVGLEVRIGSAVTNSLDPDEFALV
jgi:hypothetical protein